MNLNWLVKNFSIKFVWTSNEVFFIDNERSRMFDYPKSDFEFEALFESVYRRKIDVSLFNELQKRGIFDQMMIKKSLKKHQNAGFDNARGKGKIKTSLYLGKTSGGRKVYFHTEFSRTGISCSSTIDLFEIGQNIDSFEFDQAGGRAARFAGQLPTRRKGGSNYSLILIAYLLAFQHICEFRKVGHVGTIPSRELTRELMYLVMPEVENNESSSFYAITWHSVINAWELPYATDYSNYKRYFNTLVYTELNEMKKASVETLERKEEAS